VQPGGRFGPNHNPVLPRPQPLGLATLLISRCIREFLGAVLPGASEVFTEHLRSLEERASKVIQLHESMLIRDDTAAD
jgi:hypothetical protein